MLIRLNGDDALACEHGILRADVAQTLLDGQQARAHLENECAETLARAREQEAQTLERAQEQAQALLDDASAQADALLQQARDEAASIVEQAQESIVTAERSAYDEGTQRALAQWHEQLMKMSQQASAFMNSLNDRLAGIVTAAAERVIIAEPRAALFARALRQVQTLTRGVTAITLRVNPDDLEHAREGTGSLGSPEDQPIEVVADPALLPGACIFESELGVLDASLDLQLEALRQAMGRAARQGDDDLQELAQPQAEAEAEAEAQAPEEAASSVVASEEQEDGYDDDERDGDDEAQPVDAAQDDDFDDDDEDEHALTEVDVQEQDE